MDIYRPACCFPRRRLSVFCWWRRAIGWLWAVVLFVATSVWRRAWCCKRSGRARSRPPARALRTEGMRRAASRSPGIAAMLGAEFCWSSGLYHRYPGRACCSFRRCAVAGRALQAADRVTSRATASATADRSPASSTSSPANGIRFPDRSRTTRRKSTDARRRVSARQSRSYPCPAGGPVLATPPTSNRS